jgi:hypothetical protein
MVLAEPPCSSDELSSEADSEVEKAPLLVHIGLHKTASSWLQKHFFNDPTRGFSEEIVPSRHELMARFGTPDLLAFNPAETAAHYAPAIEAARNAGLTAVISHERLSGHPSSGAHDRRLIAERLHASFPEARVLIVIREQCELIRSMYNQHVKAGGSETLEQYVRRPENRRTKRPAFSLDVYEFDRLIAFYRQLFGAGRVLVLPQEMLARKPQEFADQIARFCGQQPVPVGKIKRSNTRRPQLMRAAQRLLNMLFFDNDLSPGALVHVPRFARRFSKFRYYFERISPRFVERRLSDGQIRRIRELVSDYYAASNRRTQELTGLPLKEFGYIV